MTSRERAERFVSNWAHLFTHECRPLLIGALQGAFDRVALDEREEHAKTDMKSVTIQERVRRLRRSIEESDCEHGDFMCAGCQDAMIERAICEAIEEERRMAGSRSWDWNREMDAIRRGVK